MRTYLICVVFLFFLSAGACDSFEPVVEEEHKYLLYTARGIEGGFILMEALDDYGEKITRDDISMVAVSYDTMYTKTACVRAINPFFDSTLVATIHHKGRLVAKDSVQGHETKVICTAVDSLHSTALN